MDWNKKKSRKAFSEFYADYLNKAENNLSENERQQLKAPLKLNSFERSALICILKQITLKIGVINRGYDGKHRLFELPTAKLPMNIRFKGDILDKLCDEETLKPLKECMKAMSISKLEKDIEINRCALEVCLNELQENCHFSKFADYIFSENRESHDELTLIKCYSENMKKLMDLQQEVKRNRQKNENLTDELENDLFNLKTECANKQKIHRTEQNMVKKWETARQEQVGAVFNHELMNLTQQRDEYEEKTERELIAINEIIAFYRTKSSKLEDSINTWRKRFDFEREDFDERIRQTQDSIDDVRSKHQSIQDLYESRAQFIDKYFMEQKQLEEQIKLERKQTSAAIRLQSWWRGTMVRKQLGPYRPKKKTKKPKGPKKK